MNTNWVYIKDLKNHVDELVEFRGWVWNKRSSGKIAFLQLRDGTGFIQGVAENSNHIEEWVLLPQWKKEVKIDIFRKMCPMKN
jgi:asparaginyl-tRNA synthetase